MPNIVLVRGDITDQDVDAIVNAANTSLRAGGGVDGAITRAAGPEALADRERMIRERVKPPLADGRCDRHDRRSPSRKADHPHRRPDHSGSPDDPRLLASCHRRSLEVADELGARTVAFPAISTGIYGYPLDEAAPVAIDAVRSATTAVEEVRFVLFDGIAWQAFDAALR